jgi:hypothetical protein
MAIVKAAAKKLKKFNKKQLETKAVEEEPAVVEYVSSSPCYCLY